jgi:hypothetical protein
MIEDPRLRAVALSWSKAPAAERPLQGSWRAGNPLLQIPGLRSEKVRRA